MSQLLSPGSFRGGGYLRGKGPTGSSYQYFPRPHDPTAAALTLTSPTSGWGAWVEITTGGGTPAALLCGFTLLPQNDFNEIGFLEIGSGAAGAEVVLAAFAVRVQFTSMFGNHYLPVPINIPSGTRVAARLGSGTSSWQARLRLNFMQSPAAFLEMVTPS